MLHLSYFIKYRFPNILTKWQLFHSLNYLNTFLWLLWHKIDTRVHQVELTFALAGRVLISWTRKVSGLTIMTSGIPVVCCTQHTRPGWFITSDHWHSAGDILLLPPLELKKITGIMTGTSVLTNFAMLPQNAINLKLTLWHWSGRVSVLQWCYGSLLQQRTFLARSWRKASEVHERNRQTHHPQLPARCYPGDTKNILLFVNFCLAS